MGSNCIGRVSLRIRISEVFRRRVTVNYDKLGAALFPVLAMGYTVFALWEQLTGNYREETINYALFLGAPVFLLALVAVTRVLREGAGDKTKKQPPSTSRDSTQRWLRPVALIILTGLLIGTISTVGYIVAFFLYVLAVLWLMGRREPLVMLTIAIASVVFVHFAFVVLLDQQLPAGFLEPWMEAGVRSMRGFALA